MKKWIEKKRKKQLEPNPPLYSRRVFGEENLVDAVEDGACTKKTQDTVEEVWHDGRL